MKLKSLTISLILFLLMISGCRTIHKVSTTIHPDGSCTRTLIIATKDTSEIHYGNFGIPLDSTWKTEKMVLEEIEEKDTVYTITKTFKSVSELNDLYQTKKNSTGSSYCEINLEKHSSWFHTFFRYQETYRSINQYNLVPISDYLNPQEMALLFLDEDSLKRIQDSLQIEEKFKAWLEKSLFEEYFHALQKGLKELNHPDLSWETVAPLKDSFSHCEKLKEIALFDVNAEEYIQNCYEILQNHLPQKTLKVINDNKQFIFKDFIKKSEIGIDFDDIGEINEVNMPGSILETNAKTVQGKSVHWKTNIDRFYFKDLEMWVESRSLNPLTVLITAALFLLILTVLLKLVKRK